MNLRQTRLAVMGVLLSTTFAFGGTYWWTGTGAGNSWATCGNWTVIGAYGCSPNNTSDDAIIPAYNPIS